jgi:hypothetical protein
MHLLVECCRHGPKRPAYLEAIWKVVNWQQVSKNYDSAVQGGPAKLLRQMNSRVLCVLDVCQAGRPMHSARLIMLYHRHIRLDLARS